MVCYVVFGIQDNTVTNLYSIKVYYILLCMKDDTISSLNTKSLFSLQDLYKGHQLLPHWAWLSLSKSLIEVLHESLDDVGVEDQLILAGVWLSI